MVGIIEGCYESPRNLRPGVAEWGVVKSPQCFEALCIKHPACSAICTHAIRTLFRRKRPAKIFVPASEKRGQKANRFSGRIDISINYTFGCQTLFQKSLHIFHPPLVSLAAASVSMNDLPGKICIFKMFRVQKRFTIFLPPNTGFLLVPYFVKIFQKDSGVCKKCSR